MKVKKKIEMLCSSNIKCSESEEGPSMALLPWLHPSKYLVTISFSLQWWDSYRNTQYQMNKEWASQVALVIKNLPAKAGDIGDGARVHLFWVRKIPWNRKWKHPQCSCQGNPMDRGDWRATAHVVTKSQTQLRTLHCLFWNYTSVEILQISVKEKSPEIR